MEPPLPLPEVIFEKQSNPSNKHKDNIYNEISASIGLECLTSSREERGKEEINAHYQGPNGQVANTPIQSSATSLMVLGKHVLTPR